MNEPVFSRLARAAVLSLVAAHALFVPGHSDLMPRTTPAPHRPAALLPAKFPVLFELNEGQADPSARFITRGPDYVGFFTEEGLTTIWTGGKPSSTAVARLAFRIEGRTGPTAIEGEEPRPTRINHFVGADPDKWRTNIRTFSRVRYRDVYPGVDLVFHGQQGQLEYDFVVQPGIDPSVIALRIEGADRIAVDLDGSLSLETARGRMRQRAPVSYQTDGTTLRPVESRHRLSDAGIVRFDVGPYDVALPLVIDPVLTYVTHWSGGGRDIAVDAAGSAYVLGENPSLAFPVRNAVSGARGNYDLFVAKLTPDGSDLVFATYLGSSGDDTPGGLDIDATGRAYVSGSTRAVDFPTVNAFQPQNASAIALRSSDAGATWASRQTGLTGKWVRSFAASALNPAVMYAGTEHGIYRTTNGGQSWQPRNAGIENEFITEIAVHPTNDTTLYALGFYMGLLRSTNGGVSWTQVNASADTFLMDSESPSVIYVATGSSIARSNDGGDSWQFVGSAGSTRMLRFGSSNRQTIYAVSYSQVWKTTNAGVNWARADTGLPDSRIVEMLVDPADPATLYVATVSQGFYKSTNGGTSWFESNTGLPTIRPDLSYARPSVRALKLDPGAPNVLYAFVDLSSSTLGDGSALYRSTDGGQSWTIRSGLLPRSGEDVALFINPSSASEIYLGTIGAGDAFVVRFSPSGSTIEYASYFGGRAWDEAADLAVTPQGRAYIVGSTRSTDLPVADAFQALCVECPFSQSAFVAGLNETGAGLTFSTYLGGSEASDVAGGSSGRRVAIGPQGSVYVAGSPGRAGPSGQIDFPIVNGFSWAAGYFVTRFSASGTVIYSSVAGGFIRDAPSALDVDAAGAAYLLVPSNSLLPPARLTSGPTGAGHAVVKVAADGRGADYVARLGPGVGAYALAVDDEGNAFFAGSTGTAGLPTVRAIQNSYSANGDAIFGQLNVAGSGFVILSYFGDVGPDVFQALARDAAGTLYFTGAAAPGDPPGGVYSSLRCLEPCNDEPPGPFDPPIPLSDHGTITARVTVEPVMAVVTVASVAPAGGSRLGGTPVTVTGTNFQPGATITIGGCPLNSLVIVSSTSATGTTRRCYSGAADLRVVNADGSHAKAVGAYTYSSGSIVSVNPNRIPPGGGSVSITVQDIDLQYASIRIGGLAPTYSGTPTSTSIVVSVGAHAVGPVDVEVVEWGGGGLDARTFRASGLVSFGNRYRLHFSVFGPGRIRSTPAGIDCISTTNPCHADFDEGTVVQLMPFPNAGARFSGFSSGTCSTGSVTMVSNFFCSASFTTATPGSAAAMSLDKTSLVFSAVNSGVAFSSQTSAQTVRLTQTGAGTVTWTAASTRPWLVVSPTSGSGSATLNISTQFAPGLTASQIGTINLTFTGARNTAGPITVTLNSLVGGTTAAPSGSFDTPTEGTTGVTGSIAVTGWAMDDVEVTGVRIMRDPVAGEPAGTLVLIGNAVLVDGARPDVQAFFPNSPRNTRAGWGYLMLTNFLPGLGDGTFKLYAIADDADGHSTLLGTTTITCTNSTATTPFGAIDTPGQGATVSGIVNNFGWVLSHGTRRADPLHGGTVVVVIDGVVVGNPTAWTSRSDLTALFPAAQFSGIANALGVHTFDTTTLTNGVHTISWVVTDDTGAAAGIGSRYFTVSNGAGLQLAPSTMASMQAREARNQRIVGRRGPDLFAPLDALASSDDGVLVFHAEELDRMELRVGATGGHLRTAMGNLPLPIGSRVDPRDGAFTWQAGPAFVGRYDLVFDTENGLQTVRVVLHPQGTFSRPQIVIDTPRETDEMSGPFELTGWALDPKAAHGPGIDAIHVWAYPEDGLPIFLGATTLTEDRLDVAAIHAAKALRSGYNLPIGSLSRGTYDLAVFAWSAAERAFLPAKTVRITVR